MGTLRRAIVGSREVWDFLYGALARGEFLTLFVVLTLYIGDWVIGMCLGFCMAAYLCCLVVLGLLAEYCARHAPPAADDE